MFLNDNKRAKLSLNLLPYLKRKFGNQAHIINLNQLNHKNLKLTHINLRYDSLKIDNLKKANLKFIDRKNNHRFKLDKNQNRYQRKKFMRTRLLKNFCRVKDQEFLYRFVLMSLKKIKFRQIIFKRSLNQLWYKVNIAIFQSISQNLWRLLSIRIQV